MGTKNDQRIELRTWQIAAVLAWTSFSSMVLVYVLGVTLPVEPVAGAVVVRHFAGGSWELTAGGQLVLLVVLAGALGGTIDAMRSFGNRHVSGDFAAGDVSWYVQRPLIGASLALLFYVVMRAGFVSLNGGVEDVDRFAIVAISGLVGLAAKLTVIKLKAVLCVMLGVANDDPAGVPQPATQQPAGRHSTPDAGAGAVN